MEAIAVRTSRFDVVFGIADPPVESIAHRLADKLLKFESVIILLSSG
ncbi:hypothetical protein GCM10011410_24030 [Hoyosella rhizosphaerae]|uniref:Uncharacterized protein n=1 Tax=Hoyosella rhizosphaerae TaxID=1755582 RepID=A0A916UFE1_9ACTN|nr:hypothetical protein GCM10011410_24030 [Hoyosella rhizosphaerae]